ncbi:nuclear transport factor 2 family protein [Actinoplanes sp. NPDC049596]|uniref:ester cyclase n=1 Tax=unclassified Actinoplanes TaxID=2626549 RepID=UPI00343E6F06
MVKNLLAWGGRPTEQGRVDVRSNEEIVREAYRLAEGEVLDGEGFRALFTDDGTFNDMPNALTFRGDQIPQALSGLASVFPDIHRELLEVHAIGDVVAVELRIQGTHRGGYPTPIGVIPPTGNRIDVPTADLWYLRDGKIERFNCYNAANVLLAQIGAAPDFRSAVEAAA